MDEPRHVLLYGKSVILGAVAGCLARFAQVRVTVVAPPFPTLDELSEMAPDVIVFDVAAPRPQAPFDLLERRPGLLMIGVDACAPDMLVLTSHPARVLSAVDLVELIVSETAPEPEG